MQRRPVDAQINAQEMLGQHQRGDADERAPENVAPAVAFLASEQSDWCTGQVLSARGYEIGLYNKPQIISQVVSPGPWDLDNAFEMIERSFRPLVESQSSSWPPAPTGAPRG